MGLLDVALRSLRDLRTILKEFMKSGCRFIASIMKLLLLDGESPLMELSTGSEGTLGEAPHRRKPAPLRGKPLGLRPHPGAGTAGTGRIVDRRETLGAGLGPATRDHRTGGR